MTDATVQLSPEAPISRNLLVVVGTGLLATGLILLAVYRTAPWTKIGGVVGLAGLLMMILQERLHKHGAHHQSPEEARAQMRPLARRLAELAYAVGLPLVLLSAVFQLVDGPANGATIRAGSNPGDVVYTLNGHDYLLNPPRLVQVLTGLTDSLHRVDSILARIHDDELLVRNCGPLRPCACPPTHKLVPHDGLWNLNAGTRGDYIALCARSRMR